MQGDIVSMNIHRAIVRRQIRFDRYYTEISAIVVVCPSGLGKHLSNCHVKSIVTKCLVEKSDPLYFILTKLTNRHARILTTLVHALHR